MTRWGLVRWQQVTGCCCFLPCRAQEALWKSLVPLARAHKAAMPLSLSLKRGTALFAYIEYQ
jgi:hypothetical protein